MGNAQSARAERQLATGTDQKQPVCEFNDGVYTRARLRRRLYRGYKYALADGMFWKYRGRYPFLATSRPGQLPGCDDVVHTCSHTNSVHDPLCKAFVRDFARKCRADPRYHPECPPRRAVGTVGDRPGTTIGERLFSRRRGLLRPHVYATTTTYPARRPRFDSVSDSTTRCGHQCQRVTPTYVTTRSAWES
jgi:hypothetical protein